MKENLIEEDNPIVQKFEIEEKTENETFSKLFIKNKCPIELGSNKKLDYQFGSIKDHKKFDSSKVIKIFDIKTWIIVIMIIISMLFYVQLLSYILYRDIKLLIFFIIVYIIGTLFQLNVVQEPLKYKSKSNFEDVISKILNSYVRFKVCNKSEGKKATYQAKYTIDITGTLNIPSQYHYARIKAVQLFSKSDLYTLIDRFEYLHKGSKVKYKMVYNKEKVDFNSSDIYAINSNNDSYSINIFTTILSILLLQWINALYYNYSQSKRCVDIYLAKLITDKLSNSPSKITIHGKKFNLIPYVVIPSKSNTKFEEEYTEKKRQEKENEIKEAKLKKEKEKREAKLRKEREEKERERMDNTKLLSHFKNINYDIYVEKVYDDVFLEFRGYTGYREKKTIEYKKELGKYDPSVQEKIEQKSEMIVYRPNGFDIRIEVKIGLHSYTITIGHKYTKNIDYYRD